MTPYQAMLHEGVPQDVAAKVLTLLQEQTEPTSWTPQPDIRRANRRADEAFRQRLEVRDEAYRLLDLVAAEFKSDPVSTQCFDSRIVERVKYIAALCKAGHG